MMNLINKFAREIQSCFVVFYNTFLLANITAMAIAVLL